MFVSVSECFARLCKVRTLRAALECSLRHDAEALMVLYGFIAGWGALSAARVDYFKASCWLWNVKCLDRPRSRLQESPSICLLQEVDHVAENSAMSKNECVERPACSCSKKNSQLNLVCCMWFESAHRTVTRCYDP